MPSPASLANLGPRTGRPNRLTISAKDALERAFNFIGGWQALALWAEMPENRADFYRLWGRTLPKELSVTGTGTRLQVTIVRVDASAQLPEQALDPASAIELPSPPDGTGNALPDHTLPSYPHPDSVDGNAGQVAE